MPLKVSLVKMVLRCTFHSFRKPTRSLESFGSLVDVYSHYYVSPIVICLLICLEMLVLKRHCKEYVTSRLHRGAFPTCNHSYIFNIYAHMEGPVWSYKVELSSCCKSWKIFWKTRNMDDIYLHYLVYIIIVIKICVNEVPRVYDIWII
jgi:hypothetical protein